MLDWASVTERIFGLNPHLRAPARDACPHGECDGSGLLLDEDSNEARPCRCRPARVAAARSRSLSREIPERYVHVAFDRFPVTEMDPLIVREVRRYCDAVDQRLDQGKGLFFYGSTGTGKTTLAMLVAQHAIRRHRTVAVYDTPRLLRRIGATFDAARTETWAELLDRIEAVDLLVLDDIAVTAQRDWVMEQLYSVVNRRYEACRSIVVTADLEDLDQLAEHIGRRAASRLFETCLLVPLFGDDLRVRNAVE
jgi:DNA replication protein DnaC